MITEWAEYFSGRIPIGIGLIPILGLVFSFIWWTVWKGTGFYSKDRFWKVLGWGWLHIFILYCALWFIFRPLPMVTRVLVSVNPSHTHDKDYKAYVVAYVINKRLEASSKRIATQIGLWGKAAENLVPNFVRNIPDSIAWKLRVKYRVEVYSTLNGIEVILKTAQGESFRERQRWVMAPASLKEGSIWLAGKVARELGDSEDHQWNVFPPNLTPEIIEQWVESFIAERDGDFEKAESLLVNIVRQFPHWVSPRQELGCLWLTISPHRHFEALDTLLMGTLSLNEADPVTLRLIGWYGLEFRQWDRAESALKLSLQYDPDNPVTWMLLSRLSPSRWDRLPLKDGPEMLKQALYIDKGYEVARLLLVNHFRSLHRTVDALKLIEEGLAIRPHSLPLLISRSAIEVESGKVFDCVKTTEKILAISPNHPKALYNLGLAYLRMKRWDEAANAF